MTSSLRVAITVPLGARVGGAENILWSYLRHVDRDDMTIHLIFLRDGPFATETRDLGFAVHALNAGRLRNPLKVGRTMAALVSVFEDVRPDLVLNWTAYSHLLGGVAAIRAGIPVRRVLWWQHNIPTGHWIDRLATLVPAVAVGCSSAASARAQQRIRPRRRTPVVYPGIEALRIATHDEKVSTRLALGIDSETPVVGIVGRLERWKGQERLICALAEMHAMGSKAHLLVVGGAHPFDQEYARSLPAIASRLGLANMVTFTGHVDDPAPLLGIMDIHVNASEGEPFGLVLLEGMSLAIPTVAIAAGGPLEIIESDRSGILLPDGEPGTLAAALHALLGDSRKRSRLGQEGREQFHARFEAGKSAAARSRELRVIAAG